MDKITKVLNLQYNSYDRAQLTFSDDGYSDSYFYIGYLDVFCKTTNFSGTQTSINRTNMYNVKFTIYDYLSNYIYGEINVVVNALMPNCTCLTTLKDLMFGPYKLYILYDEASAKIKFFIRCNEDTANFNCYIDTNSDGFNEAFKFFTNGRLIEHDSENKEIIDTYKEVVTIKYSPVAPNSIVDFVNNTTKISKSFALYLIKQNNSLIIKEGNQYYICKSIKTSDPNFKDYGTTSERPTGINAVFQYFDTTLKKPIWWTGTEWVDANGETV